MSTPHDAEWLEYDDETRSLPPLQPNKGMGDGERKARCYICHRPLVVHAEDGKETRVCPVHST